MKKPASLRWESDADGLGGMLRPPWTAQIVFFLIAAWNGVVGGFVMNSKPGSLQPAALAASAVFALLFIRGLVSGTRVRFSDGMFDCRRGPIFPRTKVTHPISDINGFLYVAKDSDEKQGHDLYMETRAGVRIKLPLIIDGPIMTIRAFDTRHVGAASPASADYLCAELERMLEDARHRGGSYRVAPGAEDEPIGEADARDSEERRRTTS